jgi:hypothetical protein
MLNARKKLVTLAVASAISGVAMMMSAPAQAVNVSQTNTGEVLLFPYYTVKNGYDTLFSVVNTTNVTSLMKIRFREALNSREVRDFNVIMSPYDVWNGVITKAADGGALVRTWDKTCTSPLLPASATAPGATEIDFSTSLFTETGVEATAARQEEGYIEVLLMGVSYLSTEISTNVVEYNAKHVSGTPRNCAIVNDQFVAPLAASVMNFSAPINVLKGHVTYINVANGQAIDAEPTALESFRNVSNMVSAPGDLHPNLNDGDDTTANTLVDGAVITNIFTNSINAVTATLSADAVVNEYASGTGAATSWVVTMPTKYYYVDDVAVVAPPFHEVFPTSGKSCDTSTFTYYNREEAGQAASGTEFSPPRKGATFPLCYEVNVVDYNGSTIFGSGTNHMTFSTTSVGTSGWVNLGLTNTGNVGGVTTVTGLPAIGFAAIMRDTGAAATNYGSSSAHAFRSGNH